MLSLLIILNIAISVIHPLKYLPQIIHIIQTESVGDLSLCYLNSETFLNVLTVVIFAKMSLNTNTLVYFIPILCEKILSLIMILYLSYLKYKFTNNTLDHIDGNALISIESIDETWLSVESIDDETWDSIESIN